MSDMDSLRDTIKEALRTAANEWARDRRVRRRVAMVERQTEAVLPILDAAIATERERIATAIESNAARVLGTYSDGLWRAARIVRGVEQP